MIFTVELIALESLACVLLTFLGLIELKTLDIIIIYFANRNTYKTIAAVAKEFSKSLENKVSKIDIIFTMLSEINLNLHYLDFCHIKLKMNIIFDDL